ncbi:MAG: VanW family protein [candidate division CPR2 bacterium GW2011_GWC1_39_9]|nr:MAG: VanW family protein [candidate division CPR2 bacterium GW2011_GWC1_39_9]
MKKINYKDNLNLNFAVIIFILSLLFLIGTINNGNLIFKNTSVAGINLSGKNKTEAKKTLQDAVKNYEGFKFGDKTILPQEAGVSFDVESTLNKVYFYGRNSSLPVGLWERMAANFTKRNYELETKIDEKQLSSFLSKKTDDYNTASEDYSLAWDNGLKIKPEIPGKRLLITDTKEQMLENARFLKDDQALKTETVTTNKSVKDLESANLFKQTESSITVVLDSRKWEINPATLAEWIIFENSTQNAGLSSYIWPFLKPTSFKLSLDDNKINIFLEKIAKEVNITPQNAMLTIVDGKATVFAPSRDGYMVDVADGNSKIKDAFIADDRTASLKVNKKPAEVREDNLNNLGIKELIATGTSNFVGSPSNRVHNVKNGASKFSGLIIDPGQIFSFNKLVGAVDASTGYVEGLVIKDFKTVPEYGGGLCQVSTTMFRTALNAGLPIIERYPHAYPVQYYSPVGTDSTVYDPNPDLKFKNDTDAHILIQYNVTGTILKFEFYGTKTAKTVKFSGNEDGSAAVDRAENLKPTIFDQDKKGKGSLTALWWRFIYEGNKLVRQDKFYSAYDSPDKYPH